MRSISFQETHVLDVYISCYCLSQCTVASLWCDRIIGLNPIFTLIKIFDLPEPHVCGFHESSKYLETELFWPFNYPALTWKKGHAGQIGIKPNSLTRSVMLWLRYM